MVIYSGSVCSNNYSNNLFIVIMSFIPKTLLLWKNKMILYSFPKYPRTSLDPPNNPRRFCLF